MIFVVFLLFMIKVNFFPPDRYSMVTSLSVSILVGFQLSGLCYMYTQIPALFKNLLFCSQHDKNAEMLLSRFQRQIGLSRGYFLVVLILFIVFIGGSFFEYIGGRPLFAFSMEPTLWSALFDIFNQTIGTLILFLFATMVWFMVNVAFVLDEVSKPEYRENVIVDILCVDRVGGLKRLKSSILKLHAIYTITITLLILSYISPFGVTYEIFVLALLLFISLFFIMRSIGALRKIVRNCMEQQVDNINNKYHELSGKLLDVISKGDLVRDGYEVMAVKLSMDTLYAERERLVHLYSGSRTVDAGLLIQFIGSVVIPIVTFIVKVISGVPT
ncbi:hypothetical protein SZ63_08740 [Methanoculleus sediminis]|uniref:Uncharacterized protein n=1 Tax=Methanoculleus sediminis TaxID=1550566 RepID=A0A0H1QYM3_9EURY|nr:hypothetical protein SZ63_08740 [Methanoculleus sediminis]